MVMYANEFETKEKQKLPEIKNNLQHIHIHPKNGAHGKEGLKGKNYWGSTYCR